MPSNHRRAIYLDHAATTPCDPRVLDAMLPWMQHACANASQQLHARGRAAAAAVELARMDVAATLGLPDSGGVLFTSGATEANNLALLGSGAGRGDVVVVGATEHPSVGAPARLLRSRGVDVRVVGVDQQGRIRLDDLAEALATSPVLVSVQAVSNETGVVQPTAEIGRMVREAGATFHVDAVQALGKVPLDLEAAGVDLVTVSAHKVNGPQGVGALVGTTPDRLRTISPLQHGGGQQYGIRPGTLNVPGIVGLGHAARLLRTSGRDEASRLRRLRDRLEVTIASELDDVSVNGVGARRGPAISNLAFDGIDARAMLDDLGDAIAASTGSACSAGQPSPVLRAMGRSDAQVAGAVRLSVGRTTTQDEVDDAAAAIVEAVERARRRRTSRRLVVAG
jgi:cysteine desulfurase